MDGTALFEWLKARGKAVLDDVRGWAARKKYPSMMASWTPEQVAQAQRYAFTRMSRELAGSSK